jgi:hypothetical protein
MQISLGETVRALTRLRGTRKKKHSRTTHFVDTEMFQLKVCTKTTQILKHTHVI